jgi:hypothetical protein
MDALVLARKGFGEIKKAWPEAATPFLMTAAVVSSLRHRKGIMQ